MPIVQYTYIYTVYTFLYVYSHPGVNRILTKSTNPHHLNARIATTFTTGSTVHKWDLTQIVVTHGLRCCVYIYIHIHAKKNTNLDILELITSRTKLSYIL